MSVNDKSKVGLINQRLSEIARTYDQGTKFDTLKRDKQRCFLCRKKGVQIHEIVPRSRFGKESIQVCFALKNRVCLCPECHAQAHTTKYRKKLLKLMIEKFGYTYEEQVYQRYLGD